MPDSIITEITQQNKINHMHANAVVIANIVELVSSVVKNIASKDTSESLSSEGLSSQVLGNIVANRIKERVLTNGVKPC